MYENLIDKLIIIEYKNSRGESIRTIARLKGITGSLIALESPTQHSPWVVSTAALIAIYEMPEDQINKNKLR